jgi:hypothetical protein
VIRYADVTSAALAAAVSASVPNWVERAADRTSDLVRLGRYHEASSMWGEVKRVFMSLQYFKCIFCERPLAEAEAGAIEQDVEHFRPKSSIKNWQPAAASRAGAYGGSFGAASDIGYFWLAYDLSNYAASCKPCNTIRKSNYFPVAGQRISTPCTGDQLDREQPFLIFPFREDPEYLITFEGVLAVPVHNAGFEHFRALVTIELFDLNGRGELITDRFRTIRQMMTSAQLAKIAPPGRQRDSAIQMLQDMISDHSPQAACARAYSRLIGEDPDKAWLIYEDALEYDRRRRVRGQPSAGA